MKMKTYLMAAAALLLAANITHLKAETLDRKTVSKDAKWLIHLDMDGFRETTLGRMLKEKVLDEHGEDLKEAANVDAATLFSSLHSFTAYGNEFGEAKNGKGVLLIKGTKEISSIVRAFLIQQVEASNAGEGKVQQVQSEPYSIYSLNGDVQVALPEEGLFILGKPSMIEPAQAVLRGSRESLSSSASFTGFPEMAGSYFFLAFADGLDKAEVPAQANVLKMTEGGRLAIGESSEHMKLNLALRARSEESIQPIQQVLQGLLAMASLTQSENPELQSIVKQTIVSTNGRLVTVDLKVPMDVVEKNALSQFDAEGQDEKQQSSEQK